RRLGTLGDIETRGRSARLGLARPAKPRRWTLPITALRVTPPRARAIWLAERPSVQSVLSCSTRSSDQFIWFMEGSFTPVKPVFGPQDIVARPQKLTSTGAPPPALVHRMSRDLSLRQRQGAVIKCPLPV